MSEFFDPELEEEETWAVRPNKSQIKRDIAKLHAMCEEIVGLSPAQIERLGLPDNILQAVLEAEKMPHKGARKRQLKFITGLMRKIDIEPIQDSLAKIKAKSMHATRELHQLERWRERMLSDDKHVLTEFLQQFPLADGQHLRQLIRNAKQEMSKQKTPKSSRQLFRYLRELYEAESENSN